MLHRVGGAVRHPQVPAAGGATSVSAVTQELDDTADPYDTDPNGVRRRVIPAGVDVYEIDGPFFFGAAETFKNTLGRVAAKPTVLILRMRHVLALDSTGMHALQDVVHRFRHGGTTVLLSDVHRQPLVALTGSAVLADVGMENVFGNLDDALNRARIILGVPPMLPPVGTTDPDSVLPSGDGCLGHDRLGAATFPRPP